ncbi:MAG TPA: CDP-alcohol phosphatidyltransferase family protein [Dehalococcoidia bacterium]|nr:CDP-alcohol phosphatidyltransferase family protein [Dehalococcoidia bacterium]
MPISILPQRLPRNLEDSLGRFVARFGVTPNMVSIVGLGGNIGCAWLIVEGQLLLAGIAYLFFSALDLVDGAVARATGQATPYGAVLDAVLDRASEGVVLAGCAWYFADRQEWWQLGFTFAAIFGSVAVSFTRALTEVEGLQLREGIFRRQERVVVLGLGLLLNGLTIVVGVIAVLSNLTAVQRAWIGAESLRGRA